MSDNKTKDYSKDLVSKTPSTLSTMESRAHQNDTHTNTHIRVSQEFLGGRFDIKG